MKARPLIQVASWSWSGVNQLARALTSSRKIDLGCRVISVGNLQAGGAGKTPLVAQIAKEACERGIKTCVLIRGYRGKWETQGGVVVPGQLVRASECGDEAALLHDLCPKIYLGVGRDRVAQYNQVVARAGTPMELVILDDGFQNFKIKKDLEVVALTSSRPSEVLYRDFFSALKPTDLRVWTKGKNEPPDSTYSVRAVYRLAGPKKTPFTGEGDLEPRFWLITGIAEGSSALELAVESGYPIARHLSFADHHSYTLGEVQEYLNQAKVANAKIALTGKDWVKWRELGIPPDQVEVLEPRLEFVQGQDLWRKSLWGT